MTEMVPVKSEDTNYDFRSQVRKSLRHYLDLLAKFDVAERPHNWDDIRFRVELLCDGINRAIESEYLGLRHSAYTSIKNQLDGYSTHKHDVNGLISDGDNLSRVEKGMVFYRMRVVSIEDRKKLKRKDIFHLPFDKKGEVKTQRFSVPGYPCLYLSHRLYGCWEEMGRPDFGTVMVSKYQAVDGFSVFDLRVPSQEKWEKNIEQCIKLFPLVIASMVQVQKESDPYKPEYLIPQLLTEWVISHNKDLRGEEKSKEVLGILYTSAQKNDDFDFPFDSYDNYAIPVLKPLSRKKYCERLKGLFMLTIPTYYDLEVLKNGQIINGGDYGIESEQDQIEDNMNCSQFGEMEKYLDDKKLDSLSD